MKAVPTEARKQTAPVIQVSARLPRHAAMKNLPHRWITMNAMKSSTPHRWTLLTYLPTAEACHQPGPSSASTPPEARTTTRDDTVSTPKT